MADRGALSSVLVHVDGSSAPVEAARAIVEADVPVFPCAANGKKPLTARGFHGATTDVWQVEGWWAATPQANIGIPTGAASGVVVVDVDRHPMVDGYESFARAENAGLVSGWELVTRSPSGGMHAYFPATPGVEQRSWQAARAGVDFRGDGGYIIVPPSSRVIGTDRMFYTVEAVNPGETRTLDAGGLRDFLDPRPSRTSPASMPEAVDRSADASRLASWVARRQEGERNAGLFWAACRLAENGMPASDALEVLTFAAGHAGLHEQEITSTVSSAYRTVQAPRSRTTGPAQENRGFSYAQRQPATSSPPVFRGL